MGRSDLVGSAKVESFIFGRFSGLFAKGAAEEGVNLLKPLGLGSTWRTVAENLTEELAMKEIMSNPSAGRALIQTMKELQVVGIVGVKCLTVLHMESKFIIMLYGRME